MAESDPELSEGSDCDRVAGCFEHAKHGAFQHLLDADKSWHAESEDPKSDLPPEVKRQKLSLWYGSVSLVLLAAGSVGFFPAEYAYLQTGDFFFDAWQRLNWTDTANARKRWPDSWNALLLAHVLTANAWVLLAALQVLTGALGQAGDRLKLYHRRVGYVAIATALCFSAEAIVLQRIKHVDWKADMTIIGNAFMICSNLVLGVLAARAHNFPLHKQAMAWTCCWTAAPGGVRLSRYILSAGCTCSLLSVRGYVAGSASMMLLAMIPATIATVPVSDEKRRALWLFFFNLAPCAGGGLLDALGTDAGTK